MRSAISSRSNSASAAKIPKTSLPAAVVVSMAAPWPVSTSRPRPRPVRSCTVLIRWRRSRPSRPQRLQAGHSPGQSSRLPDAWSSWNCVGSMPAAISAFRFKLVAWEPSAFDTRMYLISVLHLSHIGESPFFERLKRRPWRFGTKRPRCAAHGPGRSVSATARSAAACHRFHHDWTPTRRPCRCSAKTRPDPRLPGRCCAPLASAALPWLTYTVGTSTFPPD